MAWSSAKGFSQRHVTSQAVLPALQPALGQPVCGPRWTAMSGLTFALDCDIYRSPSRGTRARWSASQAATRPFCGLRRGRGRASRRRRGVLRRAWSTLSPGLLFTMMSSPSSSGARAAFSSRWDLPDRSLYSHHTALTTRSSSSTHPPTHTPPSPAAGEESESGGGDESATAQGRWYSNEGGGSEGGGGHGGGSVALTLHAAPASLTITSRRCMTLCMPRPGRRSQRRSRASSSARLPASSGRRLPARSQTRSSNMSVRPSPRRC